MLYLDGKSNCWQNFNLHHRKAIEKTLLMVAGSFYY